MQTFWDITLEALSTTDGKLQGFFKPISKCVIDKLEYGGKKPTWWSLRSCKTCQKKGKKLLGCLQKIMWEKDSQGEKDYIYVKL